MWLLKWKLLSIGVVVSCGIVFYNEQGGSTFWISGRNPKIGPLIWRYRAVPFSVVLIITTQEKAGYCYLHGSTQSTVYDKMSNFHFFKNLVLFDVKKNQYNNNDLNFGSNWTSPIFEDITIPTVLSFINGRYQRGFFVLGDLNRDSFGFLVSCI